MMRQNNYVVVGGSKGIGLGLTERLLARGGDVTVISRSADELPNNPNLHHLVADVTEDTISAADLPETIDGLAYCPGSINQIGRAHV